MRPIIHTIRRHRHSTGISSLEVLVSLTLLTSVLACATPLVVRHGRLLAAQRDYRLALDELSNQIERLTVIPAEALPKAVEQLTPSPFAAAHLPDAELKGQLDPAEFGQRLTLRLSWDEPQRRAAPVTLAAWIVPSQQAPAVPPTRREEP